MVTLLFVELCMTACFCWFSNASDLWLLLIFIFIRMSAASMFFFSSEMSLLAKLASGKRASNCKWDSINYLVFTYAVRNGCQVDLL